MRRIAIALTLAAALGLMACGGGESDAEQIKGVIETASTSEDPADCRRLMTISFLEQVDTGEGEEAVEECEADAEDGEGNPESVEVTRVAVNGAKATAAVAFHGGDFDAQTVKMGLVEEGGGWKLDSIEEFVVFNRSKLLATIGADLVNGGVDPGLATCIVEDLKGFSDSEIEERFLEDFAATVDEIAKLCK